MASPVIELSWEKPNSVYPSRGELIVLSLLLFFFFFLLLSVDFPFLIDLSTTPQCLQSFLMFTTAVPVSSFESHPYCSVSVPLNDYYGSGMDIDPSMLFHMFMQQGGGRRGGGGMPFNFG